ncbi:hypothetical protein C8F01DRAFT_1234283 [Mycena amicta]|nr:hypothetical protein C8F01DRAFT_1234283 [Mycena amicta]
MDDVEKGTAAERTQAADNGEDPWASKMWAVYIGEAEKYDKALVDSWKSDMEGLVIFAALFSAILTAFIIESYTTLSPNPGDITVQLLMKISAQMEAAANGSTFQDTVFPPFTPPQTSIVCNSLWFISLGLSLSCALIATLIQQWARDFLHQTDIHSAPLVRARIFSFLYYGLKSFRMHQVVELLPLLLHISLLLFFAGLVVFFIPVNLVITSIGAAFLFIIGLVYSILTFLPLRYLDSPYRTPLSGSLWSIWQVIKTRIYWSPDRVPVDLRPRTTTASRSIALAAIQPSSERSKRDYRALEWTLKSSLDDSEFEPFAEAIPHLLWGPQGRRFAYERHLQQLAHHKETHLQGHILRLLQSCDSGALTAEARLRRRIICLKALWAIGSIAVPTQTVAESDAAMPFDALLPIYENAVRLRGVTLFEGASPDIQRYLPSAWAMVRWRAYCAMRGQLLQLYNQLVTCEADLDTGKTSDLGLLAAMATVLARDWLKLRERPPELSNPTIAGLKLLFSRWLYGIPYRILFEFHYQSLVSKGDPYRQEETIRAIMIDRTADFSIFQDDLVEALSLTITNNTLKEHEADEVLDWFDNNVVALLFFWRPTQSTPIPGSIIKLLNHIPSDGRLTAILDAVNIDQFLWCNFATTLLKEYRVLPLFRNKGTLIALWRLASLYRAPALRWDNHWLESHFKGVLEVLSDPLFPDINRSISVITRSNVLAFLSSQIRARIRHGGTAQSTTIRDNSDLELHRVLSAFEVSVFPKETATMQLLDASQESTPLTPLDLKQRDAEAQFVVCAEFLEQYSSEEGVYKPVETLRKLNQGADKLGLWAVHPTHQRRFARALTAALRQSSRGVVVVGGDKNEEGVKVRAEILDLVYWKVYFDEAEDEAVDQHKPRPEMKPWLDDPDTLAQIRAALSQYRQIMAAERILRGLDKIG